MNDKQLDTIEDALFGALTYLQEHPPGEGISEQEESRNHDEQQRIIDKLRSGHMLIRAWRAMVRASIHQDGIPVLPGQMSIPGIPPDKTGN